MPEPKKYRRICALSRCSSFGPLRGAADGRVEMAMEEHEAIRLIDLLGCTREECITQMEMARSTVQRVYDTARCRLTQALVGRGHLHIPGGDYVLCPRREKCPGRDCARRDCGTRRCGCGTYLRFRES